MSTVEIRKPGDGTVGGPPEIYIDGERLPGVTDWQLEGGDHSPIPTLRLRLRPKVRVLRIENAMVEYDFELPTSTPALKKLKAQIELELAEREARCG